MSDSFSRLMNLSFAVSLLVWFVSIRAISRTWQGKWHLLKIVRFPGDVVFSSKSKYSSDQSAWFSFIPVVVDVFVQMRNLEVLTNVLQSHTFLRLLGTMLARVMVSGAHGRHIKGNKRNVPDLLWRPLFYWFVRQFSEGKGNEEVDNECIVIARVHFHSGYVHRRPHLGVEFVEHLKAKLVHVVWGDVHRGEVGHDQCVRLLPVQGFPGRQLLGRFLVGPGAINVNIIQREAGQTAGHVAGHAVLHVFRF